MHKPILILGIGNEYRGDDAVGIHFARHINALELPNVRVIESFGEGAELMDLWQGVNDLYICDAVCAGQEPGTIHVLEPHKAKIPTHFFNYSTHAFSLAEAIEMSRILNTLPPKVTIYGIEGESFAEGTSLSAKVESALKEVIQKFKEAFTHLVTI